MLSVAWACRGEMKDLSNCMSKYTSKVDAMKSLWLRKGAKHSMSESEWDLLLDEVIAT